MIAVGFRLLSFKEDDNIESELKKIAPRLSSSWNSGFGHYDFLYAHSQSQMKYLVQVSRTGPKAGIKGIALGDDRTTAFEITAKDYISSSALPLRITISGESGEEDRSDLEAKLKVLFISPERIQDLAAEFKSTIIQKLIPSLHKEGYEETAAATARDERESELNARRYPPPNPMRDPEPARPYPFVDPLAQPPRNPHPLPDGGFAPPGFDDEYDVHRPLRMPGMPGGPSFGGVGSNDLNPPGLGPNDPFRPGFIGGGGMHPTFDDPLFRGQGQQGGQHPHMPPGARYDPPGPYGPARGGAGRPPNPFGGFGGNDFI